MIVVALLSQLALAQFQDVTAVTCLNDGSGVSQAPAPGQRIYFNRDKSNLGLGFTHEECRVVHFFSVLVTYQAEDAQGNRTIELQPVIAAGTRSSCFEGVKPLDEIPFESATLTGDSLTLKNMAECEEMRYDLKVAE